MSLCEEVIRILGERATHRINFHQGRFRINQAAYSLVQSKLQRSEIGVEIDPDMPDRARYDRNGPTMYLWSNAEVGQIRGDAESKGLIVHECTHVITHFSSPRPTDEIEDEAIAFLAQTIYLLGIQGYTFRGSGERGGTFSQVSHRNRGRPNGRIFPVDQTAKDKLNRFSIYSNGYGFLHNLAALIFDNLAPDKSVVNAPNIPPPFDGTKHTLETYMNLLSLETVTTYI